MNSFVDGEKLATAQSEQTEFYVKLNQTKASDLDWLVIGCNFTGSYDKYAYANFNESNIIVCGSSSLQNGLLTMVLTLSVSYFLMK